MESEYLYPMLDLVVGEHYSNIWFSEGRNKPSVPVRSCEIPYITWGRHRGDFQFWSDAIIPIGYRFVDIGIPCLHLQCQQVPGKFEDDYGQEHDASVLYPEYTIVLTTNTMTNLIFHIEPSPEHFLNVPVRNSDGTYTVPGALVKACRK